MKKLALGLLWLVGCAAAMGVAWAGVSVVDAEIIDPAPATDLTATGERAPTPDPAPASTTTHASTTAPAATDSTTTAPAPPATTPTSAPPAETVPATTSAPVPTTPTPTTVATTPPPASEIITFDLVGGTTAISFADGAVSVLWATPDPGFEVSIEPEPPGIKVEFDSDTHESRLDAWWDGGPRHEIREEADD